MKDRSVATEDCGQEIPKEACCEAQLIVSWRHVLRSERSLAGGEITQSDAPDGPTAVLIGRRRAAPLWYALIQHQVTIADDKDWALVSFREVNACRSPRTSCFQTKP
jgi:hypothetical protein